MKIVFAAAALLCVAGSQAATVQVKPEEMTRAVESFLADHGDLCMAMYTWPRDVTAEDQQENNHEAVQLPVLEQLGLVQSVEIPAPVAPTKRYSLTTKGKEFYLQKKHTTLNVHTQPEVHDADFCVAHLTLDKVVRWSPPEPVRDQMQTVVKYTYHIKAAPFMSDRQAQKVFPVVDRIVRGAGTQIMTATVRLEGGHWVPVLPGQ